MSRVPCRSCSSMNREAPGSRGLPAPADRPAAPAAPGARGGRTGSRRPSARTATCGSCRRRSRRRARADRRDLAGRVGAVDHGPDAGRARPAISGSIGKDRGRRRGDVAEEQHPRARRHAGPDRLDHLVRIVERHGQRLDDVAAPVCSQTNARSDRARRTRGRWSGSRRPRRAAASAPTTLSAVGDVRDVDDLVGVGVEVGCQRRARLGQQLAQPAAEELDRLPLQLELPAPGSARRPAAGRRRTSRGSEADDVGPMQELAAQRP